MPVMNKNKLIVIVVCVAVLAVLAAVFLLGGNTAEPEIMEEPQVTEAPEASPAAEKEEKPEEKVAKKEDEAEMKDKDGKKETEEKTDKTGDKSDENASPSGNQATVIPQENVSLGVVPSADDGDLPDAPVQSVPIPAPVVPTNAPAPEQVDMGNFDITTLTYESYNAMSGAQQQAVVEMFGSPEDFIRWYNAVEAKYLAEHPSIEIGSDGTVDLSGIAGN